MRDVGGREVKRNEDGGKLGGWGEAATGRRENTGLESGGLESDGLESGGLGSGGLESAGLKSGGLGLGKRGEAQGSSKGRMASLGGVGRAAVVMVGLVVPGAVSWGQQAGGGTAAAKVPAASISSASASPAAALPAAALPAAALPSATGLVSPAVQELGGAVAGLRIAKWKAPGPVKDDAESNVGSITRDLEMTLPALLAQSDAAPQSVADAFAVYRNLDALYEVALRVSGTADLAAPDAEAASLAHALTTLETARRSLADSILTASQAQEAALKQRQTPVAVAAPAPVAPTTTVVSDGPGAPVHRKAKAKPKPAPPQN